MMADGSGKEGAGAEPTRAQVDAEQEFDRAIVEGKFDSVDMRKVLDAEGGVMDMDKM